MLSDGGHHLVQFDNNKCPRTSCHLSPSLGTRRRACPQQPCQILVHHECHAGPREYPDEICPQTSKEPARAFLRPCALNCCRYSWKKLCLSVVLLEEVDNREGNSGPEYDQWCACGVKGEMGSQAARKIMQKGFKQEVSKCVRRGRR